jgi:hypothetical protein
LNVFLAFLSGSDIHFPAIRVYCSKAYQGYRQRHTAGSQNSVVEIGDEQLMYTAYTQIIHSLRTSLSMLNANVKKNISHKNNESQ